MGVVRLALWLVLMDSRWHSEKIRAFHLAISFVQDFGWGLLIRKVPFLCNFVIGLNQNPTTISEEMS